MKIVWSGRAASDLTEIRDYIAADSEANAASFLHRLFTAIEALETLPDRGRRVPEAPDVPGLRELLFGNYRVIYRSDEERVEIVTVVHGRRNLAGLEAKPWHR